MKKTRFFSRICAAFLAVATAVMPLATTGAAADPTYTVKIISPDVPNDGTYTYKFYQIISGEVEQNEDTSDTLHKFVISNPQWGAALGGEKFTEPIKYPEDHGIAGDSYNHQFVDKNCWGIGFTDGAGTGYGSYEEALFAALSGTIGYHNYAYLQASDPAFKTLEGSLYKSYSDILSKYGGVSLDNNGYAPEKSNFFYGGFNYGTAKNLKSRDIKGFVELLNQGVNGSKNLRGNDLQAFADLLWNGADAKITHVGETEFGHHEFHYDFISDYSKSHPKASVEISNANANANGEYTVTLDEPGYYLVACVKEDGSLTNDGYEKPKPLSMMLLLVGEGENEIVGKNTTAVATVDFKMFHETVDGVVTTKADDSPKTDCTYEFNLPDNAQALGYFDDSTKDYNAAAKWVDRATFGNLQRHIAVNGVNVTPSNYDEYVLCRIDITLPENFESYKDVGYFLAVAGDWDKSETVGKIVREWCRPLVYVKHKGEKAATYVEDLCLTPTVETSPLVTTAGSQTSPANLSPLYAYGDTFKVNDKKTAVEYFYLGNLFNTGLYSENTFKGGDHIYIYFPAYYTANNAAGINGSDRMILSSSAWAIYSNNPYSLSPMKNELINTSGTGSVQQYQYGEHIASGDVGISKTSSVNVNNYSVNVRVTGKTDDKSQNFDRSNAKYALYRMNGTTKEYALIYYGASDNSSIGYSSRVCGWYSKDAFMELKPDTESWFDENGNLTSVGTLGDYYDAYFILLSNKIGGNEEYGRIVHGLAPGTYYIEELDIGAETAANIHTYHYQKATQPFKVTIGQKYNKDYGVFATDTKGQLIDELSVTFAQADPADRTIETEIITPAPGAGGDKHSVTKTRTETEAATADGIVEVKITHNSLHLIWLPETGGIGTTIFFIVGGAIVVAATVLIVTRFRVKRERL